MAKDPQAVAQQWATRLGQSGTQITEGIQRVTQAPGAAAARQSQVWVQNVTAAQDKWKRRVGSVTLAEWQEATITKGVPRIAQGANAAVPKMAQFMQQLLPYVDNAVASLPARGDLNANIGRMVAFTQKMAAFKRA